MSISQRKYFVLLHDPDKEYPLGSGMLFDKENLEAMLSKGSFTPGTVLERDGQRFAVLQAESHQGSKYLTQEIRAI